MKKFTIIILAVIFLQGCSNSKIEEEKLKLEREKLKLERKIGTRKSQFKDGNKRGAKAR